MNLQILQVPSDQQQKQKRTISKIHNHKNYFCQSPTKEGLTEPFSDGGLNRGADAFFWPLNDVFGWALVALSLKP